MPTFSAYYFSAEVAKSVDAVDSKSTVEIRAGSSPAFGTISQYANQVAFERLFLCLKSSIRKDPSFIVGLAELNTRPCIGIAHQRYYGTLTFYS